MKKVCIALVACFSLGCSTWVDEMEKTHTAMLELFEQAAEKECECWDEGDFFDECMADLEHYLSEFRSETACILDAAKSYEGPNPPDEFREYAKCVRTAFNDYAACLNDVACDGFLEDACGHLDTDNCDSIVTDELRTWSDDFEDYLETKDCYGMF